MGSAEALGKSNGGRSSYTTTRSLKLSWKKVASTELIVLALVLWFMVALSLHILLADGKYSSKEPEVHDLRSMQHRHTLKRFGKHAEPHGRNNNHQQREEALVDERHRPHFDDKNGHKKFIGMREQFEAQFPPDDEDRIRDFVSSIRNAELDEHIGRAGARRSPLPYDPLDCPDTPHPAYPLFYPLLDVLEEWPVDKLVWPSVGSSQTTAERPYLFHSLCIFDWTRHDHRERIKLYQIDYDLPFLIRNHPEFLQTTERWMRDDPNYLDAMIGDEPQRTEHSTTNHLPFWRMPPKRQHRGLPGWVPPTENTFMTFLQWHEKALQMDQMIADGIDHTQQDHFYFRLNGDPRKNEYLYKELPVFDPSKSEAGVNIFMWEPNEARGINCRWGMAGNVAEAHYDGGRNWIVLLGGGQRRYILGHPRECPNLALYPVNHPSGRHSSVDWSEIGRLPKSQSPAARALSHAQVTQVVLQASDALFLPTNWFHFIVSLNRNYQCNARSGKTDTYDDFISDCGFPT